MTDAALRELAADPFSRERFLRMAGGGGTAAALAVLVAACGDDDDDDEQAGEPRSSEAESDGDLKIVNYALTLEHLEAEFYRRVVDSGVLADRPEVEELAREFGQTEADHVTALEATARMLGGEPVEPPATRFDEVIDAGQQMVLTVAADIENLGAAAYLGQAANIRSKEILAAALAIHTVEARHAAALNELIERDFTGDGELSGSVPNGAFAQPLGMAAVLQRVQPFLAS